MHRHRRATTNACKSAVVGVRLGVRASFLLVQLTELRHARTMAANREEIISYLTEQTFDALDNLDKAVGIRAHSRVALQARIAALYGVMKFADKDAAEMTLAEIKRRSGDAESDWMGSLLEGE